MGKNLDFRDLNLQALCVEVPIEILKIEKLRALELEASKLRGTSSENSRFCDFWYQKLQDVGFSPKSYVVGCLLYKDLPICDIGAFAREDRDRLMSDPTVMEIISDFLVEKTCA